MLQIKCQSSVTYLLADDPRLPLTVSRLKLVASLGKGRLDISQYQLCEGVVAATALANAKIGGRSSDWCR
jgi:hypothetical protein